jgi:hypothetical protein
MDKRGCQNTKPMCLRVEEVAVHSRYKILEEIDDNSALIVGDTWEIL